MILDVDEDRPTAFEEMWEFDGLDLSKADDQVAELAKMQTASSTVSVGGCEYQVRGEDCNCDDVWPDGSGPKSGKLKVRCEAATVTIPGNAKVIGITCEAKNANGGGWSENPYRGIGWCDFSKFSDRRLGDGRRRIAVTLKNWSHNLVRLNRITVRYRA